MQKYFLIIIFLLSSCSSVFDNKSNAGAKVTTASVAAGFITNCLEVNYKKVSDHLFSSKYTVNQDISLEQFQSKITNLKEKWALENHPLAGLVVSDVDLNGNFSTVTLKKDKSSGFPSVIIKLEWAGGSWAVIDDNIFGKGEIYDSYK